MQIFVKAPYAVLRRRMIHILEEKGWDILSTLSYNKFKDLTKEILSNSYYFDHENIEIIMNYLPEILDNFVWTFTLAVESSDTILSCITQFHARTGIPMDDMRFIYAGRQLEWDKTLSCYNIQQSATINCILRLRAD